MVKYKVRVKAKLIAEYEVEVDARNIAMAETAGLAKVVQVMRDGDIREKLKLVDLVPDADAISWTCEDCKTEINSDTRDRFDGYCEPCYGALSPVMP